jgi:hypothetical protein
MPQDSKTTELQTYDFGSDANVGFENQSPDEQQIPLLGIIQAMSPQVTEGEDKFIVDARPGMLFNSATNELLGKEISFVPAVRQRAVVEWIPLDQGGGFVSSYEPNDPVVLKAQKIYGTRGAMSNPDTGNDLVPTTYVFGVYDGSMGPEMIVIPFTSTKLKVWRRWNTAMSKLQVKTGLLTRATPPMFAHLVTITTDRETNTKGTYFNFKVVHPAGSIVASLLRPSDERYMSAKALQKKVVAGMAAVAASQTSTDESVEDSDNPLA